MAVPLHNHSEYSQIDGVSTPKEIAKRVITDMGCPCCGLTDHGVVAGHLEFDKEIRKAGGKPIFGCELYHGLHFGSQKPKRDQAHLIALAMTDEGLKNLWRLNDAAAQEDHFYFVGRNSWQDLRKHSEGIVITSACVASLVCQGIIRDDLDPLNQYLEIFGDNFYLELSTYPGDAIFMDKDLDEGISPQQLNEAIVSIGQERGIGFVYGDDGHYAFPEQYAAHDAYVARSSGDDIYMPIKDRGMWHPEGALCIKTEAEVRKALSYLPDSVVQEALDNTDDIAERADAHLPGVERRLPVFVPDESPWVEKGKYADEDADLLFLDLLEDGIVERYGEDPKPEVVKQTFKEAEIFIDSGLHHYFLLAWDVMQFCDEPWRIFPDTLKRPIERGPGRGSSAGCIAAYELGITDIDPLPYDLIFERFWNPGRAKGFPDIDSDFEKGRRRLVKDYLTYRWGHDRVRSIGTVSRMKPLDLIEKMGRACGLTFVEADELKKIVEKTPDLEILGHSQIGWDRTREPGKVFYVMEEVGDEIVEWVEAQRENRHEILIKFLDHCETLCSRVSGYGVHASGIVISSADLPDIAPCRFAGSKEQRVPVTQFAMDDIEALMLVKFDALGLRTLDVLSDWKAQMKEQGVEVNWSGLEWEEHPKEMWELLHKKYSAGIFQIEGGYAARLAEALKPESVADLSMIGALNRPGPIRSGAPESFILRRSGQEAIAYDDPFLEDILQDTYGWFLYQESVIQFFNKLGYNQSDADAVRKILGKKQPEKWEAIHDGLEEWKDKSYVEMCAKAGVSKEHMDIIWSKLQDFGKYSFNKSHSVAYGTVGFRCVYAKFHGPAEFYMASIRHVDKNKKSEQIPAFVNEARRWDIKVHGPDIERSDLQVGLHDGDIYFGFDDIKGVATEGAKYLLEARDAGIDISSPEALNEWKEAESKKWSDINKARKKEGKPKLLGKSPGQRLNSGHIEKLYTAGAWERLEGNPSGMRSLQLREKEMLSVILSDNTAEAFANNAELIDECDYYEDAKLPYTQDQRYRLPGVITEAKPVTVKNGANKGAKMGIVTIEFEGETLEFAVFSDKWESHQFMWHERTPGIFTIKHSMNKKTGKAGYHFESGNTIA